MEVKWKLHTKTRVEKFLGQVVFCLKTKTSAVPKPNYPKSFWVGDGNSAAY